jgi:hypothetical protein
MLKIYMLIFVLGIIGGVGYGAYAYYQDTQQELRHYKRTMQNLKQFQNKMN